jgi:hypothetical protein
VSLFQYASEEALGMASKARIAAKKICWSSCCYNSIILTAMDRAIYDGVHVISLFVGTTAHAPQYDHDLINCHRGILCITTWNCCPLLCWELRTKSSKKYKFLTL